MGARSLGPIRSRKSGLSPSLSVLCGRPVKQALCSLVPSVGVRDGDADDDDDDARARSLASLRSSSGLHFAGLLQLQLRPRGSLSGVRQASCCLILLCLPGSCRDSGRTACPCHPADFQFPTPDASVRKDAALTQLGLAFSQNLLMSNKIKNTDLQTNSPTIYRLRLG